MEKKTKRLMAAGAILFFVFVLFTLSLLVVDVKPIGPGGSRVGYAKINEKVHDFIGVHMTMYLITDWAGVFAIAICAGFALFGLFQWIQRKDIRRVDKDILLLGAFYLFVIGAYAFFEYAPVNYRPVLINGILEASYPSSTTVLSLCVLVTAMIEAQRRIRNRAICRMICVFLGLFLCFMVAGRLISGVHWCTDIIGGALFSASAITIYSFLIGQKE